MANDKLLIVQPKVGKNQLNRFVKNLEDEGVKYVYADPKVITDKKSKMKTIFTTPNADYVVLDKEGKKIRGKKVGKQFKILSNKDSTMSSSFFNGFTTSPLKDPQSSTFTTTSCATSTNLLVR